MPKTNGNQSKGDDGGDKNAHEVEAENLFGDDGDGGDEGEHEEEGEGSLRDAIGEEINYALGHEVVAFEGDGSLIN